MYRLIGILIAPVRFLPERITKKLDGFVAAPKTVPAMNLNAPQLRTAAPRR
jgi:hypothetical protein